jgi:hypothetical protein
MELYFDLISPCLFEDASVDCVTMFRYAPADICIIDAELPIRYDTK